MKSKLKCKWDNDNDIKMIFGENNVSFDLLDHII